LNVDKTRWEKIDQLLHPTERTRTEVRVEAAHKIAEARFKFPSDEFPGYKTFVNLPETTMTVKVADADLVPDIVVVDHPASGQPVVRMAVIVAGAEQVTEAEANERWAPIASIPGVTMFVYVPSGYADEAKRLCAARHIEPEGFRTWRNTPTGFEINDVGEAHSTVRGLIPRFARRALGVR
jgi:hypothetical protein